MRAVEARKVADRYNRAINSSLDHIQHTINGLCQRGVYSYKGFLESCANDQEIKLWLKRNGYEYHIGGWVYRWGLKVNPISISWAKQPKKKKRANGT